MIGWGETSRRWRARREAVAQLKRARKVLRANGSRVGREAAAEVEATCRQLQDAVAERDHDAICAGLVRLDDLYDRHLSFARKSTAREYVDSIAVAVLVALLLRTFVVEAFKIPSASMIPTLEVGDHIFVNKFIYGVRIPFTRSKLLEWRKPQRGEVIVFIYPLEPSKDFIKRVVGVEGDCVEVKDDVVYVNGDAVPRHRIPGLYTYWDYNEQLDHWERKVSIRYEEELGGEKYITMTSPHGGSRDYPLSGESCVIPPGRVFVLGDNRNNSHDSRFWGSLPFGNIKGKALVVWWSSGGPEGVRWNRLGHVVD